MCVCVWLIRPNLSQHVRRYEICVHKLLALSPRCVRAQQVTRCSIPSTSCRCRCCCCYYYYCQCRGLLSSALLCTLLTSLRSVPFRSDTIASDPFRSEATAAAADEDDNSELMCQVRVVPRMKQFIALSAFRCFASCSLSVAVSVSVPVSVTVPVFVSLLAVVALN